MAIKSLSLSEILNILSNDIYNHLFYHIKIVIEFFLSLDDICLGEETAVEASHEVNEELNGDNAHNLNEDDIVPKVHMCFEMLEAVKVFYRNYAINIGFGVRIRSSLRGADNEINYIKLVCSREGNYVSVIPPELKTVPSEKKQCKASITVGKKEGKWYIRSVVTEHSHDTSPKKLRLIRGNCKVNMHARQTSDINDEASVRINKSFQSLVCEAGGYDNISFIERDVRNYIGKQRRSLCKDGDGQALLRHFPQMRELNSDFFFDIDMDKNNRICNVFWADARS